MARPKIHVIATAPVAVASVVVYPPMTMINVAVSVLVVFFGIFIDIDHLCLRRAKNMIGKGDLKINSLPVLLRFLLEVAETILFAFLPFAKKRVSQKGKKGPVPGWINPLHTWHAAVVITLAAIIVWLISSPFLLLPAIAYWDHILVDAGNRDNLVYPSSPVPLYLHRFCPERLKYSTGLIV